MSIDVRRPSIHVSHVAAPPLVGTGELLRLALRRDRIWLPVWVLGLALELTVTASALASLYPDTAARSAFARTLEAQPALLSFYGPGFAMSTLGGLTMWRAGGVVAALAALMSLLTVLRHTRAEEETGRLELVRAGVVSRHAATTAALLEVLLANTAIAVLLILGLAAQGMPVSGAAAAGVGIGSCGLVFGAVAALTSQLSADTRVCRRIAVVVLALAYVFRAVGDATPHGWSAALHWLSPIGWSQQLRPFGGERWAVLVLPAAAVALLLPVALRLSERRDLGGGLFPVSSGSARGRMGTPLGLAWRLQRGSLLAWALALGVLGALFGGIADAVPSLVNNTGALGEVLRKESGSAQVIDGYFATVLVIAAMFATVHTLQAVLRLHGEESEGHAELLVATAVSRRSLLASHALVAVASPVVLMAVAGLAAGSFRAHSSGDVQQVWRVLAAALVQVPAMWVLTGAAVLFVGLLPQRSAAVWPLYAAIVLLGQLGTLLGWPGAVLRLSPYVSTPPVPARPLEVAPLAILLLVAVALATVGVLGYTRRDLT